MAVAVLRDLRPLFGTIRDQGARPTCLAFAASDCHAALRDGWIPLSCEFAFYHAQRRAGLSPHTGSTLEAMLVALRADGQPAEMDWPYLAAPPGDLSIWSPPTTIRRVYRRAGEGYYGGFDEIVFLLEAGRPALVLITLSDAFYSPDSAGVVIAPVNEVPDPLRRHAVVAVAHGTLNKERAVMVRNSWGPGWGLDGHAWITETYLAPRLTCLAILTEEVRVPKHPNAT